MSSFSSYLPGSSRLHRKRPSINGLPVYTNGSSAVREKLNALNARTQTHSSYSHSNSHSRPLSSSPPSSWWLRLTLPIPFLRVRPFRIFLLNPRRLYHCFASRLGRKRGFSVLLLLFALLCFIIFALAHRFGGEAKEWPQIPIPLTKDSRTLVYSREDLQRIWKWEIESGHYPSRRGIPEQIRLKETPLNPALPPRKTNIPFPLTPSSSDYVTTTHGQGPERIYLDIQSRPPNVAYPPRPVPGSVADLDLVMEHCDFSKKKFVRDCLEVLRVGAGLDNGKRLRRGRLDDWKYIYVEKADNLTTPTQIERRAEDYEPNTMSTSENLQTQIDSDPDAGLRKKRGVEWEKPPISLPPPIKYKPYASLPTPCDPDNPRIFHMFWTGPVTDKPYLAMLSFLFTQNTGLHVKHYPVDAVCRPKFWLWINPGPAAAVPNPNAVRDVFRELKDNPWASPFLHPRFKDIIKFKIWNTTEQLDGIPELREEWRSRNLFSSNGNVINVSRKAESASETTTSNSTEKDDMLLRTGSSSASTYDRLSVVLSDLVRFVLCHRYGGIYLDADTIFLRDWEELWGWRGAFAYRWSRLPRYNTAVLKLNRQSALGTFLFRTALKNNFDFHPIRVSAYTKEAGLESLLLRLPDALFDSAWLNTESYQLSRPPQPFFTSFEQFFDTPLTESAAPQALGFEGFFRGAFSYHFHNFWWKPFDPARNWPDLGPQFKAGERAARAALLAEKDGKAGDKTTEGSNKDRRELEEEEDVGQDRRDLDWATVLKRTFEGYIRGERPNMYGEWLVW